MSTRRRSDDDFEREIRAHLELEADGLVDDGLTPEAARAAARRRFGNVAAARERFYEMRRILWLDQWRQDVRSAIRNLRRYPGAALVAVLSLAAGIGATTVTLTVRDVVFHKPPPLYRDPGQLSKLQVSLPDRPIMPLGSNVPGELYKIWSDALGPSIGAAIVPRGVRDVRTADRSETNLVRAVSPDLFALLGVQPEIGPGFGGWTPGDSRPLPAVLSYRVWQRLFDSRADVVGQVLWIAKTPHVVAGVMPERFWLSDTRSPIWVPFDAQAVSVGDDLEVFVRRPAGVSGEALAAQLQSGISEYSRRQPGNEDRPLKLKVSTVEGTPLGNQVSVILPYVLGTSVLLTLIIACANVAILMIAQWTAREHEIAIRAAIGASRGRVVRTLVTESVVIAIVSGVLGVGATIILQTWVVSRAPSTVFFDLSVDPRVFLQAAIVTVMSGLAAGLAPALYETRRLQANPLRSMAGSDRVRQRWRQSLVVLEIMVTVALLVETAALVDGYQRASRAALGFDTHPLLIVRVENPSGVPADAVANALMRLPGAASAAATASVPYATFGSQARVATDGSASGSIVAEEASISDTFFSTLGLPLRAGRAFARSDAQESRVAIINETMARRLFEGESPLGRHIWVGGVPYDVVGIAADYSNNPLRYPDVDPKVFLPLAARPAAPRLYFVVRAENDPAPLVKAARRHVESAVASTVVGDAYTFDQILRVMGQEILVGTAPLVPLISIGILLTVAGIYGVLSFAITRRSRELAVRMAIGASGRDLVWLVTGQTLRLVASGTALGIGVTFALSRIVRASGGAGSVYDPTVRAFVVPVLILAALGALSSWIPSRRAARIDPAALLRSL